MREGGRNCLKYLKREWNRKKGREDKDFKNGWQIGLSGGCLKWGGGEEGGWNPLMNYGVIDSHGPKGKVVISRKTKQAYAETKGMRD